MTAVAENKTNQVRTQEPKRVRFVRPDVDITEHAEYFQVTVDLPGVRKEHLKVTMEDGELAIEARKQTPEMPGRLVYRETVPCEYRRVFQLETEIDASGIKARLNQGVLSVTLPKSEQAKPRQISIA